MMRTEGREAIRRTVGRLAREQLGPRAKEADARQLNVKREEG